MIAIISMIALFVISPALTVNVTGFDSMEGNVVVLVFDSDDGFPGDVNKAILTELSKEPGKRNTKREAVMQDRISCLGLRMTFGRTRRWACNLLPIICMSGRSSSYPI